MVFLNLLISTANISLTKLALLITGLQLGNWRLSYVKSNVSVATSAWVSSNTYSDYPYQASITVSGCTSNHVPEVVFSPTDVSRGIFAPVCSSTTNAVIIYATEKPSAAITVLTVECRRAL